MHLRSCEEDYKPTSEHFILTMDIAPRELPFADDAANV